MELVGWSVATVHRRSMSEYYDDLVRSTSIVYILNPYSEYPVYDSNGSSQIHGWGN